MGLGGGVRRGRGHHAGGVQEGRGRPGAGVQLTVRLPEELQGRGRADRTGSGATAGRAAAPRSASRLERRAAVPARTAEAASPRGAYALRWPALGGTTRNSAQDAHRQGGRMGGRRAPGFPARFRPGPVGETAHVTTAVAAPGHSYSPDTVTAAAGRYSGGTVRQTQVLNLAGAEAVA